MIKVGRARGGDSTFHRVIHMLPMTYPQIGVILLAIFVIGAAIRQFFLIRTAYSNIGECISWVQKENKRAVSLRRIAELESTLTELTDSYEHLLASHKKLRSRIGMRAHRAKSDQAENGIDLNGPAPLDESQKAAYKQALRHKLRATGALK